MLTAVPPQRSEEEQSLLTFVHWWRHRSWTKSRSLVAVVAVMHLVGAYVLAFAPDAQLITQGTRPVFALMPQHLWAVAFLIGGSGAASLLLRYTGFRQLLTWITVLPTQTIWIAASVIAVAHGRGAAMSMVFLPALLSFTLITAVVVAVDFASGKR